MAISLSRSRPAQEARPSPERTTTRTLGPAISGRGEDYVVSYRVNGGQPVQIAAGSISDAARPAAPSPP
jgi:hypothetical protein